jgi:hypothetical protein
MNMRGYGVFSAFILVSSTVLGGPANSQAFDAIPAATSSAVCVNNELGQVQETAASCALSGSSVDISTSPAVDLTTTVSSISGDNYTNETGASLQYYFEVVGGVYGTPVSLLVDTDLAVTALGYAGGSAGFSINALPSESIAQYETSANACMNNAVPTACTGEAPTFDGTLQLTALVGRAGVVTFSLLTGAAFGGTATVTADPYIRVDPATPDAGAYSIELSAGVANGSPVPEPAAWVLTILGFGALGGIARHRRALRPALAA